MVTSKGCLSHVWILGKKKKKVWSRQSRAEVVISSKHFTLTRMHPLSASVSSALTKAFQEMETAETDGRLKW